MDYIESSSFNIERHIEHWTIVLYVRYVWQGNKQGNVVIKSIIVSLIFFISCSLSMKTHAVEVITHVSVHIEELTKIQLRRIYSMRQINWPNGSPIVVYVLPSEHRLHLQFSKESLQIFPYQLDRIWNKLTFSGLGRVPILIETPKELIEAVMKTPGSIGYMDDSHKKEEMNVVKVSG